MSGSASSSMKARIAIAGALVFFVTLLISSVAPRAGAEPSVLLTTDALGALLSARDVRIIDMADDVADYRHGHIPGAVFLDIEHTRVVVPGRGFRLPNADEASRLFGGLGLTRETRVVVYDHADALNAAWLFYVLDVYGHTSVALLDGGLAAWKRAGRALVREAPRIEPTTYRVTAPAADRVATAEWIRDRLSDRSVIALDARSAGEYAGTRRYAKRAGHIPGAVNVEWSRHLREDGTFKPVDELRRIYAGAGVTSDKTLVTYCQTHHRGAHSYFVLRLLGYPRVLGYDRSWAEWGNRDDLPIAR